MAWCYILFSEKLNRFYIGATHTSVQERIDKHNTQYYGVKKYTAKSDDWILFLSIEVEDYSQAVKLERLIKSKKSSQYIRNLKKHPELVNKLISNISS